VSGDPTSADIWNPLLAPEERAIVRVLMDSVRGLDARR